MIRKGKSIRHKWVNGVNTTPRFPPFYFYIRNKTRVTFVWRCPSNDQVRLFLLMLKLSSCCELIESHWIYPFQVYYVLFVLIA